MRIGTIDIETKPHAVYTWGLFNQNIGLNQVIEPGGPISFAWKWKGTKKTEFYSDYHDGHEEMVRQAHRLLTEANAVIHYNGTSFDVPHLNREFALLDLGPPEPFAQIDLLRTARKRFRFMSNKLDHVSQQFKLRGKVSHEGFGLWVKCMANDPKAWAQMKKYNIFDVVLTEQLYDKLLPWLPSHPNAALYDGADIGPRPSCERCGSDKLTKQGLSRTQVSVFQQWKCGKCGSWSRSAKRLAGVDVRGTS